MTKKEAFLKELNIISKKNDGMLRPIDVVEFAKNQKTALHGCFTWNNSEAAEQWRLHQARMLIRVTVTILSNDDETEYRAFVSMKDDRYSHLGYRPMISVLEDEELRETMLEEALEEMQIFKEKYKSLKELALVFEEMDRAFVSIPKKKRLPLEKEERAQLSA